RQVLGLSCGLREAGTERGDRIGIYLDASVPQVLSIFGTSKAGGVFVPINGLLFPEQVAHIARDCGMKGLIGHGAKMEGLRHVLKEVPSMEFVVTCGPQEALDVRVPQYRFEEMCSRESASPAPELGIERDLAAILYTSGSTGKPKGVMLSH